MTDQPPIKIVKKDEFSKEIEDFHQRTNSTILESIIFCSLARGLEIETISPLLTADIKIKLEGEAIELRLLVKKDKEIIEFE